MTTSHHSSDGREDESDKPAIRIVLIEDNKGDIFLTREAFDEIGVPYSLRVLTDGEKAHHFLHTVAEGRERPVPDLILLDINLPKLDGHELLAFIKRHEQLQHIPVVMFTTSSAEKDVAKAYKNQVNCYITKPAEAEEFIRVLQEIEQFWSRICQLPGRGSTSH